jgi:hypothetical protein
MFIRPHIPFRGMLVGLLKTCKKESLDKIISSYANLDI